MGTSGQNQPWYRLFKYDLKQRLPFLVHLARWVRWARSQVRYPGAAWRLQRKSGGRVLGGPFKGLRIPLWQTNEYSALLGIYEQSLIPTIEDMIARKPRTVIDAGAAYGYYALGFAMRLPDSRVIAYEIDRTRRVLVNKYGGLNGLEGRVDLRGECTIASLARDTSADEPVFIMMDIEGAEASLLDPRLVPGLCRSEILVELHEMFVPGVTQLLQERFAATHQQTLLPAATVHIGDLDRAVRDLIGTDDRTLLRMIDEKREGQTTWLHLRPRS
jgi:hypothetical protein